MENNLKIIEHFEMQQLESFNNNGTVIMLEKLCSKLDLEFKSKIDFLQDFKLEECRKRKLVHSGYLVFEVLCDGIVVEINNDDDYGCLSWAEVITELKTNGMYKLFKWDAEYPVTRSWEVANELLHEVNRVLNFLQGFKNKEDFSLFIEQRKINSTK